MDPEMPQTNPDVHKAVALLSIAFALKYGEIDTILTSEQGKDSLEDQIKNVDQQIRQLKEQSAKLEELMQSMQDTLAKFLNALGSDRDEPVCPDSDPRKLEFYRLWDAPVPVSEDWRRLSASLSSKEKESFTERMLLLVKELGLSDTAFSILYPGRAS